MNLVKIDNNRECYNLKFGREKIKIFLSFTDRKNLKISVHPDQKVTVDAPIGKKLDDVLSRVIKRAPWIVRQKNYFEQFQPLPTKRQYISGETHFYLGRQYRLKIVKSSQNDVKLIGRYFYIYTNNPNNRDKIKKLLDNWYCGHAEKIFTRRFERCYNIVKKYKISRPGIRLRKMTKRWGSCTKSGTINLNTELVKVSLYCIDYVIIHEICHLKVPNHGNAFYGFLSKCLPDWKQRKERIQSKII